MGTTALSGAGFGFGCSSIVNVEKIGSELSPIVPASQSSATAAAAAARWWKMIEAIVRAYSMLTSETREEAFICRSLSRSVFSASPTIRATRSFSIGGSSSVGMHSMYRWQRSAASAASRAAYAATTRRVKMKGSSARKHRSIRGHSADDAAFAPIPSL